MLNYKDSNTAVFGWTLATKAYLYYNIITIYLHYILSYCYIKLCIVALIFMNIQMINCNWFEPRRHIIGA